MKKVLTFTAMAALMASCSNDTLVDVSNDISKAQEVPMNFVISSQNMTRAQSLESTGIYNFGVFAYKSSEPTYNVMDNYLVGYMDETNKKGYYMTIDNQTTLGDVPGTANGSSMWAYEKMGNTEYDYTGGDGYYTKDDKRYISNNEKQYLRYWDKAADYTTFYAYTPYINKDFTLGPGAAATYDNATKKLTLPAKTIHDGYNNPTDNEVMFASAKVGKANYGQDVPLLFKHLVAKVNIKFYEEIDGYSVRVLNLSNNYGGVYAVPAIKSSTDVYTRGTYYQSTGAVIEFDDNAVGTVTPDNAIAHNCTDASELLQFAAPVENEIGTTKATASASLTTYYAVPKAESTGGLTFHVSYEMTSTTGERITVNNATVHVPANMCAWAANKHYTYIFKITKNSNGTTEDDPNAIDPTNPDVPGQASLLPIIFDNCTVEEWDIIDGGEYNISDANTNYYSIKLDRGNVIKGSTTDNVVTAKLLQRGNEVTSAAGTWSLKKPGETTATTLTTSDPKTVAVTVGTDWAVGEYTLIFTPAASMSAPNTAYETKFYVISGYSVSLNSAVVGTRGKSQSELTITTDQYALKAGLLSIEYPTTVTSGDDKNKVRIEGNKVIVKKDATPGNYAIVYTAESSEKSRFSFEVKDYNPSTGITGNRVELSQSNQTFTVTPATVTGMTYSLTGPDATNVTLAGNVITVKPAAAVGQYKLTLTVDNNGTETTYERTFEVVNVYSVKIYKGSTECYLVDNDDPTDTTPVNLTVVATKNGAEDTTTSLGFTSMTGVSLSGRTITVERNGTPSNYIVSYIVDGKTVAAATLVVTD